MSKDNSECSDFNVWTNPSHALRPRGFNASRMVRPKVLTKSVRELVA